MGIDVTDFCRIHNLHRPSIQKVLNGQRSHHVGWTAGKRQKEDIVAEDKTISVDHARVLIRRDQRLFEIEAAIQKAKEKDQPVKLKDYPGVYVVSYKTKSLPKRLKGDEE